MTNMNDFDAVMNGDFEYEENESTVRGYPRIWWFNGNKTAGTAGHFYTSEKEFPEGLQAPWVAVQRFEDADGFTTESLSVVPIRKRYQPFIQDPKDRKHKMWLSKNAPWEKGMSVYTEILCFMEGYDGLVILAVKGMTGKALTNRTDGIFKRHADSIIAVAKKTAKKGAKIPPFMFWVPITGKRTAKGKVEYTDTGYSSVVTLPELAIQTDNVTREDAKKWFIGAEMLEKAREAYESHNEWRLEERAVESQEIAPQVQVQTMQTVKIPAPPKPVNVPQPIADDDDEF